MSGNPPDRPGRLSRPSQRVTLTQGNVLPARDRSESPSLYDLPERSDPLAPDPDDDGPVPDSEDTGPSMMPATDPLQPGMFDSSPLPDPGSPAPPSSPPESEEPGPLLPVLDDQGDFDDDMPHVGTQTAVEPRTQTGFTELGEDYQPYEPGIILSDVAREALDAHEKGAYELAKFFQARDLEDKLTKKGPSINTNGLRNYILSIWYYPPDYIRNVILGRQEEIFASPANPLDTDIGATRAVTTGVTTRTGPPPPKNEPIIYGNFLGGENGEQPHIGHLRRILNYFEVYVQDVVATETKATKGAKWKVERKSQDTRVATIVYKIETFAMGREGRIRREAARRLGGQARLGDWVTRGAPDPAITGSDDTQDPADTGADTQDVENLSAMSDDEVSEGSITGVDSSRLVLQNSPRKFFKTDSSLKHARKWAFGLRQLIHEARSRGLVENEDIIDRFICDIGWTWESANRRASHESYSSSIPHMNLVDAICRTYLAESGLAIRFHNVKRVLEPSTASADEHNLSRMFLSYASDYGFNVVVAGSSVQSAKRIAAHDYDLVLDKEANKHTLIDNALSARKDVKERLARTLKLIKADKARTKCLEMQDMLKNKTDQYEEAVKKFQALEKDVYKEWDGLVETFEETYETFNEAKHVYESIEKPGGLLHELDIICKSRDKEIAEQKSILEKRERESERVRG